MGNAEDTHGVPSLGRFWEQCRQGRIMLGKDTHGCGLSGLLIILEEMERKNELVEQVFWRQGVLRSTLEGTQKVWVPVTVAVCASSVSYGILHWGCPHCPRDKGLLPHLVIDVSNCKAPSAFVFGTFLRRFLFLLRSEWSSLLSCAGPQVGGREVILPQPERQLPALQSSER